MDFVRALRDGVAPDGSHYYPVFPFPSYTRMRESDMRALFAYLRGLKPAARPKQEHELAWFARFRFTNWLWKLVFFEPGELRPDAKRSVLWNRGAYIAQAMAHCGECHSPRGLAGGVDRARHLSGNSEGPGGDAVPNITPHVSAEFREWDKIDIGAYLSTGEMPDGDYAGGMMAEVIDEGLTHLTKIDSEALVEYIMALRPLPTKE
ncbi:MAG: cytochrome c [Chromatiales bacterium]|nr:cytochrome c [Chromatiales bacterium]